MRDDGGSLMQRVRIGLTGLACVFLLVLLAASVFGLFGRDTTAPRGAADGSGAAAGNGEEAPKEPLAELGVTPGNAPDHLAANEGAAPAAATRPRRELRLAH